MLIVLIAVAVLAKAWHDTMAPPIVQRQQLPLLPPGEAPIRIALLADIHVAGPDMPPSRLETIVAQVNALKPDLVLIAGDMVSDKRTATHHYSTAQAIAPLAALQPTIATVAVPGNHDHWRDMAGVRSALQQNGVILLENAATRFGPLTIGGLDDDFTGQADLPATVQAMAALGGVPIMLSHSPDPFPDLPPSIRLMLAGHTHCGQIGYPWGGSPATMSRYGDLYACGLVREQGRTLITSAGMGTSVLPIRLFTRPEIWLIDITPAPGK
ncbi:metallophosphoesterase [Croceibacterium xixiisoli]|nr:metallophosphoesterase [Croceibacterium xixiisoli]